MQADRYDITSLAYGITCRWMPKLCLIPMQMLQSGEQSRKRWSARGLQQPLLQLTTLQSERACWIPAAMPRKV